MDSPNPMHVPHTACRTCIQQGWLYTDIQRALACPLFAVRRPPSALRPTAKTTPPTQVTNAPTAPESVQWQSEVIGGLTIQRALSTTASPSARSPTQPRQKPVAILFTQPSSFTMAHAMVDARMPSIKLSPRPGIFYVFLYCELYARVRFVTCVYTLHYM